MGEPVEQCGGELLRAEDLDPFSKGEVTRHDGGAAFISVGKQVKQQFGLDLVEGDEAELVENE